MGERGPAPKRDAERRRRNTRDVPTRTLRLEDVAGVEVEVPVAPDHWHEIARQWYESLPRSLAARFYEPSDWATAYMLAEQLHRELQPKPVGADAETGEPYLRKVPIQGASLTALLKGFSNLLVTEADRRRLSVEVERNREDTGEQSPAGVTDIESRRAGRLA